MTARGVYDLVKRHVKLPVNTHYDALKHVLRDWVQYTEHTALAARPTFYAELHIDVIRPAPPLAPTRSASSLGSLFEHWVKPAQTLNNFTISNNSNNAQSSSSSSSDAALHRYRHVVPLRLWTAVLPWEVQRGLSYTALPSFAEEETGEEQHMQETEGKTSSNSSNKTDRVNDTESCNNDDGDDDLYGVVSVPADSPTSSAVCALPVKRCRPGMLFLLDAASVARYGVNFWCGAILQPIDVLFLAATLPSAIAESASFAQLRQKATEMSVEDNAVSAEVIQRYFPHHELRSALTEWRVLSHNYLEPSAALVPAGAHEGNGAARRTLVRGPACTSNSDVSTENALPQYVLETVRHVMRDEVHEALRRSAQDWQAQYGTYSNAASLVQNTQAELELRLELSDALKDDLMAKAQLAAHYVPALQDNLAMHLRRRRFAARTAEQHSGEMAEGSEKSNEEDEGEESEEDASASEEEGDGRPMRVWLSETESVWMTPRQMAAQRMSARKAQRQAAAGGEDNREENGRDAWATTTAEKDDEARDDAAYMQQPQQDDANDEEQQVQDSSSSNGSVMTTTATTSITAAQPSALHTAASASFVQPAQPHGVQASRRLALQSPMLAAEDEGRPKYLAPSFLGRHESAALQPHALVVSAGKLARYPATQPQMPAEAPVDYELFVLCARLGLGMESVMHHYYDRIVRDWTQELRRLVEAEEKRTLPVSRVDTLDVQRMRDLVSDASLQLPEELCSLVHAVAARRLVSTS